jgi:hypothetical protein
MHELTLSDELSHRGHLNVDIGQELLGHRF